MIVDTVRFGRLVVEPPEVYFFPRGLYGFEDLKRYFFVPLEGNPFFTWLQAVDDGRVAFLLVDPFLFFNSYEVAITAEAEEELKTSSPEDVAIYAIVTIPPGGSTKDMTVNLLAPVVVNAKRRRGIQLILDGSRYSTRERLFTVVPPEGQAWAEENSYGK